MIQSLVFSLPTTPLTYFFILSLSRIVFWVLRFKAMEKEGSNLMSLILTKLVLL